MLALRQLQELVELRLVFLCWGQLLHSIVWTFGIYFIGGLYVLGAILPWLLFGILCWRWWQQDSDTPLKDRIRIPIGIWMWIGGMVFMQVSLIMGHLDYYLEMGQIIKSSIGWAKGWAILALFPMAGCLPIRPKLLYRAAALVCTMVLLFSPIFIAAYHAKLPTLRAIPNSDRSKTGQSR